MQPSATLTATLFLGLTALTAATTLAAMPATAFNIRCAPGSIACETLRDRAERESPPTPAAPTPDTTTTTTITTITEWRWIPPRPSHCGILDVGCSMQRVAPY